MYAHDSSDYWLLLGLFLFELATRERCYIIIHKAAFCVPPFLWNIVAICVV
jgi:hypothetical protein